MKFASFNNYVGKAFALTATLLVLPLLTYAGHESKSTLEVSIDKSVSHSFPPITSVPEANTGIVLIPFIGAMILCGSVQLFRAKRARESGILS
jgi:hypothetical protein